MRSHKTICMAEPALLLELTAQEVEEFLSVLVPGVDALSRVASSSNMVDSSLILDP